MSNFDALVAKLREIFQIDRPDLDFGVYRILNARAGEIEDYLSKRLKARVAEALAAGAAANTETLKDEIAKAEKSAQELGISADQLPKVQQLRAQLAAASAGASEHENQVFSHLLTFFLRYYDKGDFISQRRYKGDTYAIPYSGEEVVLHWANRDQYYTKSGESFSNFSFKLDDGRAVHFRLVAADTAKDNRKDNDKERRFVLATARTVTRTDEDGETFEETIQPVAEDDGALVIRFDYAPQPKGTKQEALVDQAVAAILDDEAVKARWLALTTRAPTEKNPKRTLLEKHLTTYTQKNTADYFIHKDLGGFLRRELDFYIKNEVMNLDDVQGAEAFAAIEKNLRMIQCLRAIALDLITFLASIENFQKKLWLKKKFVVAAQYCVTLDRVPETLYPAIAANPAQWAQWHALGMRASAAPGTVEDLKTAPFLMVDTALFDAGFRADLLKAIPDLDASLDGLLVHGDNFQALSLLGERYREKVKCVYIDPPYNTGSDGFTYKDRYQHSSWATMIADRMQAVAPLMSPSSSFYCNLNDIEDWRMRGIISSTWGDESYITTVVTKCSTASSFRTINAGPVDVTDRIILAAKDRAAFSFTPQPVSKPVDLGHFSRFVENIKDDPKHWTFKSIKLQVLQNLGFDCDDTRRGMKLASEKWGDATEAVVRAACEKFALENADAVFETKTLQKPSAWLVEKIEQSVAAPDEIIVCDREVGEPIILIGGRQFYFLGKSVRKVDGRPAVTEPASTLWLDIDTNNLRHEGDFEFKNGKKPVKLIQRAAAMANAASGTHVCDYFAGSGSTGHAVIELKRSGLGNDKYMLVEQGPYFDTVLKPRIQKVVFAPDWKNGKPRGSGKGISHAFKVLKIEGYEDTLNNLDLKRSDAQASLLEGFSADKRDEYLMRYMLDVEAKGSLLSVSDFRKPFDYTLKVAVDSAGAWEERKVDLIETFNYLIGLTVRTIDIQLKQGFVTVEGWLPTGEKTLILWRDCEKIGYEELTRLCDKLAINPADSEYDVVYINGDHNIPSVVETTEEEGSVIKKLMLRQIEPAFLDAMFNVDDV